MSAPEDTPVGGWRNPQLEHDPARAKVRPVLSAVGRRRWWFKLKGGGDRLWRRVRYPFTRRTVLRIRGEYNPKTLARERTVVDKRPIWWLIGLTLLAVLPPLSGNTSLLSAATIFAIYASINLVWMLIIGTAGIFSLATLAVVGASAYGAAWLSIQHGLPWWGMISTGAGLGLAFGVIVALPAIRLEGFYYALLTLGLVELCRVYVVQSKVFGSATGGLYGADTYVPEALQDSDGAVLLGYAAAFVMLLAMLGLYRLVNGQRLGRLLRTAREDEAFAEAVGIGYDRARVQVFLISSVALGAIGGFYASHFKGVSPSIFSTDQLLLMLAMIVIGGIGTAEGAVVGTLIVVLLDKLLIEWGPMRLVLIGLIMLGTVLFTRGGLFGIKSQFRAWRERRKSERRAARTEKGGEVVPEEATDIHDKQAIYYRRQDKLIRDYLRTLVTDELIEEHRRKPLGQHSEALERVLNYFRRGPVPDKYAVMAIKPFEAYRVVALAGRRGVPPRLVDDRVYPTLEEAYHAVFLRRVNDLLES
ncbi:MAG: branched-chain amino acid ABC transporter permease [Rhodocyclaceae bacterium]|nr:branched-chain amino acid ABC transporter permease [Rhodocyclaceae bacterium]MCA3136249.1 branched-chain amino acid ABC transporter permease [Rhodocyclaceae bacterium]MCA3146635.1 branched-chain amino acid ABC transporter permease [Rhodocyclaceae bacterium]